MSTIPRLSGLDHTLGVLLEGYDFLPRRFERLGSDALQTRLLLEKTVCVRGAEASELFYDTDRFTRRGALPPRIEKTLFGRGGVQGLDGTRHRVRKAAFMSLMDDAAIDELRRLFESHWRTAAEGWARESQVELLHASEEVLCRAACDWAGVPLPAGDVPKRTRQLGRLIDAFGGVGPRYWKGRIARKRANAWMEGLVEDVRRGRVEVPEGTAMHTFAFHEEEGHRLEPRVAAVELLNVIRPTVAVGRFIAFAALALHEHGDAFEGLDPEWRWDDGDDRRSFVQELRRYYPFVPFLGARVRNAFEWRGHHFEPERLVVLDVYGTNHDAGIWDEPEAFRPRRFRDRDISPFTLIPQGGGDHHQNHRCAGEWMTIALMDAAVRMLTLEMEYEVPPQDLSVDHSRMPAEPASGMVIAVSRDP